MENFHILTAKALKNIFLKLKTNIIHHKIKWSLLVLISIIFSVVYYQLLPQTLFDKPYSKVLLDKNGDILNMMIAADGQWRFPKLDSVPEKFTTSLIEFEDKRFNYHFGIDPLSIGRALINNIKNEKIVSGGSTITMQVIRMSRERMGKSWYQKILEMIIATRLEWSYSKKEILNIWATQAPMGGNIVGLHAASWRYFGHNPDNLSWAEAATLAVLPNAPTSMHITKNRAQLIEKRNLLLKKLYNKGHLDKNTLALATSEPLPLSILDIPNLAPHLTHYSTKTDGNQTIIKTTIDPYIQKLSTKIIHRKTEKYKKNNIRNACALIINAKNGEILSYVGNTHSTVAPYSFANDMILTPRSTGSILKPFLYAYAIAQGEITPESFLPDIPSNFGNFSPKNYDKSYRGAVKANKALSHSLNIPFVHLLNTIGVEKFHHFLQSNGFTTIDQPASHYGLSLILGGAEITPFDLGNAYCKMTQSMFSKIQSNIHYTKKDQDTIDQISINRASIYHALEAMKDVVRPGNEKYWQQYVGANQIAWKTGTSFGHRDAWSIGITTDYIVVVWVGNADGYGQEGLTGAQYAGPILFDIFQFLQPKKEWFPVPYNEMVEVQLSQTTGFLASENTPDPFPKMVSKTCLLTKTDPYHKKILLDSTKQYRVTSECYNPFNMQEEIFLELPPIMDLYFKKYHHNYKNIPDFSEECISSASHIIQFLNSQNENQYYIPTYLNGIKGNIVFEVKHQNKKEKCYWFLDGDFKETTIDIHQIGLCPTKGKHELLVLDEKGNKIIKKFTVIH